MKYIDIHTHSCMFAQAGEETVAVYNVIVGKTAFPVGQPFLPLSCGIHPWYIRAENREVQYTQLQEWAGNRQVVMIGEAGLDKEAAVPLPLQTDVFEMQIGLAEETGKPLLIHCVKAWDELLAVRKRRKPAMPWIVHGFRKKGEQAGQLIRHGLYLSFGEHFHEEALWRAWPDRLLLETDEADCPVEGIYRRVASVLHISEEELARQIGKTARQVFGGNEMLNF